MPDLQDDIRAARRALRRLRDAFEQKTGTPANGRSERALQMSKALRAWEEEFGAGTLEKWAEEHERELMESHGGNANTE
jgi:hypothetical protein